MARGAVSFARGEKSENRTKRLRGASYVCPDVVPVVSSFPTRILSSPGSPGSLRSGVRSVSGRFAVMETGSAKGSQPVSAKGKLGHLTLPGTLRYSVQQRERRKKVLERTWCVNSLLDVCDFRENRKSGGRRRTDS